MKIFLYILFGVVLVGGGVLAYLGKNNRVSYEEVASVASEKVAFENVEIKKEEGIKKIDIQKQDIQVHVDSLDIIQQEVPFAVQAPQGQWGEQMFQDGCEEASMIMALSWVRGEKIIHLTDARDRIVQLSHFEKEQYGFYLDVSTEDVARAIREYYRHEEIEVVYDFTKEELIESIYSDSPSVIIAPMNGQKLGNPHFTQPGPERHMLVIIGYDPETKEFITNDPGTRQGKGYRYNEDILYAAIRDYSSGYHEPIEKEQKAMIIIKKWNGNNSER